MTHLDKIGFLYIYFLKFIKEFIFALTVWDQSRTSIYMDIEEGAEALNLCSLIYKYEYYYRYMALSHNVFVPV